jgi:transcriptional regulator with XRE-family HTH domain
MEEELPEKGYSSFGKYLRAKRKQLKISQNDLADKAKFQRTYLSMLESRGNPSFQTILQIADALGMTLEEFFRIAPVEAREPKIVITGEMPNPRYSALLIKSRGTPVPIVHNDTPLRTKMIVSCPLQRPQVSPKRANLRHRVQKNTSSLIRSSLTSCNITAPASESN